MMFTATGIAALPAVLAQGGGGQGRQGGRGGGRGRGGMGGGRALEMMKERLDLSPEQVEKIQAIYAEQGTKMREMREKAQESGPPPREAMMKMREETNKKIGEVLSKEQKTEYDKMLEEFQERMRGGGRGGDRRPPQQQ